MHNDLAGLQGGSSTERYHLTLAQYTETNRVKSYAVDWNNNNPNLLVNHNLGTRDIGVHIYDKTTGANVLIDDIVRTSINAVSVTSSVNVTNWRVVVFAV